MSDQLKMNDESIIMIAKLVQIAMLTGTDVVDNLRTLRFESTGDGVLGPHPEFVQNFEDNLQRMQNEIRIPNQA
jgi:hypothetical protein